MQFTFKQFIIRLLIFGSPIWFLIISYIVFDPFHVIYSYDAYGSNYLKTYNRNKISTETFLKNNQKYNFSSFIFGSSRSSAFLTQDWSSFINDPKPYHFDAFNDNISGIAGKVKYIEKQGNKISNAILVVDNDTFNESFEKSESIVHLKDYRWEDSSNVFQYHLIFFKAFFKKQYFVSFFDLKIFKTFRPYMDEFFKFKYFYTTPNNDFLFPENIELLKKDSLSYYKNDWFPHKPENPKMYEKSIKEHHLKDLELVADAFKRNKTNYKVIIAPLYDQRAYNLKDKALLEKYFGKNNVYDYSGKNELTNYLGNYYEGSHFKPVVGKKIMQEIYQ
jgi:hypothetical protein